MTEPPAPDDLADAIRDALAACIERIAETGRFDAAEPVLSAHPEHAAALRERLAKLHRAGMLPLADGPAEMPRQLGEFVLLEPLGRGGMGVVHLARQASLDRLVAVKLVHPELLYFPGARERFRREVEAVARLQHPGIVPVYSVGEEHGIPYFAMERLIGATLADVIADCRRRPIDSLRGLDMRAAVSHRAGQSAVQDTFAGTWTESACRLVANVALALQHAHERGVLHRDLKPSNVMLTVDGRAVLLDFGLAAASGTDSLTKSGAMVGTLAYMAPEQVRGEPTDARSDVYSLGATLYELLALAPAHTAPSSDALREAVLRGSVVALARHNHSVPRDVDTICRKAMDVDPARRYPTAAALAEDLERFLAHRPIHARPASPWLRLRRWTKRHPAPAAALGVASLALAVTASLLLQRDSARDESDANLRSALEAVGVLVDRAKSPEFVGTPGLDPIRAQQLDDAVDLLQRLHEKNESNPRTRLALAKGLLDAARLRRDLGRSAGAAEATATARSILQVLLRDHADDAAVLATAASLELLDGSLHRAASDLEAAERRFAEALRLLQPLGDRDDATLLALRAAALVDLANLDRLSKDLDRADTRLHEAI
ncbi:MAG: Serine/threonine-protein kinase PrkC, partial [Planctomycetota bacterium]